MTNELMPGSDRNTKIRLAGIATTAELHALGVSDARIRVLVRQGILTQLDRGVYARRDLAARVDVGPRGHRLLRIAAALALVGPDAVASHRDAAVVHRLDLLDRPPADRVTVSWPRGLAGGQADRPTIVVCRSSLPSAHVTRCDGVPVTTVARTVVDMTRTTPFRSGVVVADSALRDKKVSRESVEAVIAICARWPGIGRARQVAAFADGRSESPFESISRVAFRDGGLPPPDLQVWVGDDAGQIGRVDFLWREHRTVAEADGAVKYADPHRARAQLRRDARLREAGFEVVHFSWSELMIAPDLVIESIRAAFRRAAVLRAADRPSA